MYSFLLEITKMLSNNNNNNHKETEDLGVLSVWGWLVWFVGDSSTPRSGSAASNHMGVAQPLPLCGGWTTLFAFLFIYFLVFNLKVFK